MSERRMVMEYIPIVGEAIPNCSDPTCDLDASVFITEGENEKRPWCTGHAHVEIACWMTGL